MCKYAWNVRVMGPWDQVMDHPNSSQGAPPKLRIYDKHRKFCKYSLVENVAWFASTVPCKLGPRAHVDHQPEDLPILTKPWSEGERSWGYRDCSGYFCHFTFDIHRILVNDCHCTAAQLVVYIYLSTMYLIFDSRFIVGNVSEGNGKQDHPRWL